MREDEKARKNLASNPSETNIVTARPQTKEPRMRPIATLLFAALLSACASSGGGGLPPDQIAPRTAWIVGSEGRAVGQVTFTEGLDGVLIRLEFSAGALTPG